MKTKTNFNKIASASVFSAALFISSFTTLPAATTNDLSENEVKAASERLDTFNKTLEKVILFRAPAVNDSENAIEFDAAAAVERLDKLIRTTETSIRFNAPAVDEDASAYDFEVYSATERLENLADSLEASVRFVSPQVSE